MRPSPEILNNKLYSLEAKAKGILSKKEYEKLDNVLNLTVDKLLQTSMPFEERYNVYTQIIENAMRRSLKKKPGRQLTDYIKNK